MISEWNVIIDHLQKLNNCVLADISADSERHIPQPSDDEEAMDQEITVNDSATEEVEADIATEEVEDDIATEDVEDDIAIEEVADNIAIEGVVGDRITERLLDDIVSSPDITVSQRRGKNVMKYANKRPKNASKSFAIDSDIVSSQILPSRAKSPSQEELIKPSDRVSRLTRVSLTGDVTPHYGVKISAWMHHLSTERRNSSYLITGEERRPDNRPLVDDPFLFIESPQAAAKKIKRGVAARKGKRSRSTKRNRKLPIVIDSSDDSVEIGETSKTRQMNKKPLKITTAKIAEREELTKKKFMEIDEFDLLTQNTFQRHQNSHPDVTDESDNSPINHSVAWGKPKLSSNDSRSTSSNAAVRNKSAQDGRLRRRRNLSSNQMTPDSDKYMLSTPSFSTPKPAIVTPQPRRKITMGRGVSSATRSGLRTRNQSGTFHASVNASSMSNTAAPYNPELCLDYHHITQVDSLKTPTNTQAVMDEHVEDITAQNIPPLVMITPPEQHVAGVTDLTKLTNTHVVISPSDLCVTNISAPTNTQIVISPPAPDVIDMVDLTKLTNSPVVNSPPIPELVGVTECERKLIAPESPTIRCAAIKKRKLVNSWRKQSLRFKRQLIIAKVTDAITVHHIHSY